jgi:hypothetical protein
MKVGNNSQIWFTTLSGNTLGVIEKSNDENIGYKISTIGTGVNTNPAGLYVINDSVWVANEKRGDITHFKVNREGGLIKDVSPTYKIPSNNKTVFSSPTDLVVYKDSVWLTEHGTSFLTEHNMRTGQTNRYPTSQSSFHVTTLPFWIRTNNASEVLWFNEHQGSKIALFNPSDKTLTEYRILSLPKDGYITYPLNIAIDPHDDRILWFSEWNTDKVGVINGHLKIPFELSTDMKIVKLDPTRTENTIDIEIKGDSPYNSNRVIMNVSSSILPDAELGNLTAKFSSDLIDLSNTNKVKLFIHDYGVTAGNYTLGISASDGFVTKTIFLDLSILKS